MKKPYKITLADINALYLFQIAYPTWWFTVGVCDLTRDFSCAPQETSPEIKYAQIGNQWDQGFHVDHRGSISDAVLNVMKQIKDADFERERSGQKGE